MTDIFELICVSALQRVLIWRLGSFSVCKHFLIVKIVLGLSPRLILPSEATISVTLQAYLDC